MKFPLTFTANVCLSLSTIYLISLFSSSYCRREAMISSDERRSALFFPRASLSSFSPDLSQSGWPPVSIQVPISSTEKRSMLVVVVQ